MNIQTGTVTGGTPSVRSGSSRKLLARKAMTQPQAGHSDALEDVFPVNAELAGSEVVELRAPAKTAAEAPNVIANATHGPASHAALHNRCEALTDAAKAEQPPVAAPKPTWSDEDERAYGVMAARRKASGFQRRGKNVGGQLLRPGSVAPNSGTVVATIVALVANRGTVTRAELLDAMAVAEFGSTKARPQDRSWSNGYVAGAVRDGFLEVVAEQDAVETSPAVTL